ncbi:MAG: 50S ribosomal protein L29 [Phycisphaeraceae bacterium]|nr:50S ribosomal protein L29 [Phycisphaeraceae bacterium]
MKSVEVHKLTDQELTVEVQRLRHNLYEVRCQAVTEKLENPMQIGKIKRDIARLLTESRSRQIKTKA